jgi:poly-gamma-glutamate synthesis protein (capsule biosynthesis protein)
MTAVLAAVGDILIDRPEPREALRDVAPLLEACDVVFGNFEGVLTDARPPDPGSASTVVPARNAGALESFDVLSLANNHALDVGRGGLADTIAALRECGVAVVGAGATIGEARAAAIVARSGVRVAFLAATSVLRIGTEAGTDIAGVAPLRADDYFAPRSRVASLPGVPPRVVSVLDEGDKAQLLAAVADARAHADVVAVSVHWGDHTQPWVLTDHERACARLLVASGADLVLGHHQHFFRGGELVDGTPVFYGLGHIAFDQPRYPDELRARGVDVAGLSERELVARFGEYGIYPRPGSPDFPFHPLARRTGVALVELGRAGVVRAGVAPFAIGSGNIARPVRRGGREWDEAVAFLRTCVDKVGLETEIVDRGWVHGGYDVLDVRSSRST